MSLTLSGYLVVCAFGVTLYFVLGALAYMLERGWHGICEVVEHCGGKLLLLLVIAHAKPIGGSMPIGFCIYVGICFLIIMGYCLIHPFRLRIRHVLWLPIYRRVKLWKRRVLYHLLHSPQDGALGFLQALFRQENVLVPVVVAGTNGCFAPH